MATKKNVIVRKHVILKTFNAFHNYFYFRGVFRKPFL